MENFNIVTIVITIMEKQNCPFLHRRQIVQKPVVKTNYIMVEIIIAIVIIVQMIETEIINLRINFIPFNSTIAIIQTYSYFKKMHFVQKIAMIRYLHLVIV